MVVWWASVKLEAFVVYSISSVYLDLTKTRGKIEKFEKNEGLPVRTGFAVVEKPCLNIEV